MKGEVSLFDLEKKLQKIFQDLSKKCSKQPVLPDKIILPLNYKREKKRGEEK